MATVNARPGETTQGCDYYAFLLCGPPGSGRSKIGQALEWLSNDNCRFIPPYMVHSSDNRQRLLRGELKLGDAEYRPEYLDMLLKRLDSYSLLFDEQGGADRCRPPILGVSLFSPDERKQVSNYVNGRAPLVYLDVPDDELRERVRKRHEQTNSPFTPKMLEEVLRCWEKPQLCESMTVFDASGLENVKVKARRLARLFPRFYNRHVKR
ncbi:MAG: hypothetical protein KDD69_15785 [Bdellovibrionales bacterium]|nr:hypothetical protein [Bdellovibrionales bacterium]